MATKLRVSSTIAAAAVGAALLVAPEVASAQKLSVGMPTSPPNIVHMPLYVAQDLGLFKAEGVDVEALAFEGGVKSFRAVVSGDIDVAGASGPFSIVGRARGAKTKLFLTNAPKLEASMVVQPSIKSLQDLQGKRIGIQQPGGFAWVLSMTVLRSAGLKEADVKFVSILSEDVPPLLANQIDTAMLHVEQEMVAKAKRPDLHTIARLWEIEPDQLYLAFAVKESTIAAKRKALVAMAKAHILATRLMYTDKARVMPSILKHTGLPPDIASKSFDILVKSCIWDANNGLSRQRVAYTTNRMVKVGNIDQGKVPAYEDVVDLSIADEALKALGPWKGPLCPG
ncbi:MAG: ABC transporter substrate-binding protein [Burkholderiales bacterium]